MRLAYLCNIYPAVSHSFVRREVEALERAGHEVARFSLRPYHSEIKDRADLGEASRTESILSQGWSRLIANAIRRFILHPAKSHKAIATAYKLSSRGLAQKARNVVYLLEAGWLVERLSRMGVVHLHAHFGTNPAVVAAIARAWGGPPFSFTVHGPEEFDAPVEIKLSRKIEASSFVVAISSYCRSQLMRWVPQSDWDKIKVIRCGVDAGFRDAVPDGPSADSRDLLTVARLSEQKGLPLLIDACARLRDRGERFRLTIVGYGDLQEALQMSIRKHNLEDYVVLVGIKSSDEIRELLLAARAFVLPSFAEGLPIVLMEALALARPVVSTAIAGIPELVDQECGWLIPAGSIDDLVAALEEALHAPAETLSRKGLAGRERALRLHDADRNALQLAAQFEQTQREGRPGLEARAGSEAINAVGELP